MLKKKFEPKEILTVKRVSNTSKERESPSLTKKELHERRGGSLCLRSFAVAVKGLFILRGGVWKIELRW